MAFRTPHGTLRPNYSFQSLCPSAAPSGMPIANIVTSLRTTTRSPTKTISTPMTPLSGPHNRFTLRLLYQPTLHSLSPLRGSLSHRQWDTLYTSAQAASLLELEIRYPPTPSLPLYSKKASLDSCFPLQFLQHASQSPLFNILRPGASLKRPSPFPVASHLLHPYPSHLPILSLASSPVGNSAASHH